MIVFPEIAYAPAMQQWLFVINAITTVVNHIAITELITVVYGQRVSRTRKFIYALVLALVFDQFWIYGIYALGGFINFSPFTYALIVHPNPVFALLYYWLGVKILGLSKYRSVHLMRTVYLYILILRCLGELSSGLIANFTGRGDGRYNFLLDAICSCAGLLINLLIYAALRFQLRIKKPPVQLFDGLPVRGLSYEIFVSFLQSSVAYAVCTMIPYYFKTHYLIRRDAYLVVEIFFFVLLMLSSTLLQYSRTVRQAIDNKNSNMRVLINAVDDFSGLKHDFFNILQTYEGYIAIGDLGKLKKYHRALRTTTDSASGNLDLAHRMSQNLELMSMLTLKQQQATTTNRQLNLEFLCDISNFYIPNEDLCRAISLLLDAALSQCPEGKNTIFSVEQKADAAKLIMINGSNEKKAEMDALTPHASRFPGTHTVTEARQILYRYNNAFFHGTFSDENFFAYIELRAIN